MLLVVFALRHRRVAIFDQLRFFQSSVNALLDRNVQRGLAELVEHEKVVRTVAQLGVQSLEVVLASHKLVHLGVAELVVAIVL